MGKSSELFIQIQENLAYIENEDGYYSNLDALIEMREYRSRAEEVIELTKAFETKKITKISEEASLHNGKYKGFQITETAGRKTFDFKKIPEWRQAKDEVFNIENKYKSMFDAVQKGNPNANVSEDGEELPLPEINYGKSFITVKKI